MHLAIQLMGAPQFQLNDVPITPSRRAVTALVAYLAVSHAEHPEQRHTRESLAALLWTDYDQTNALANLRHTIWEVAKLMGEGWILPEHEAIYWNPQTDLALDVAQFRSLLKQASQASNTTLRIPLLVEATALYRDDFLSGFSLKGAASFNEWMLAQAEKLRAEFASGLSTLVEDYKIVHQPQSAIPYAQRLIALDPMSEAAQRNLMELYALTDQTPAAIRQYQSLEKLLRKELNLDPQPETRELYKQIRRGGLKPSLPGSKLLPWKKTVAKHNLPFHLTTFIGREKEREDILRLVDKNRLVTLIGAGGIGKTRLAQQAGEVLLKEFADGVWFISLESVSEEELVPKAVAAALGITQAPGKAMIETLVEALGPQRALLIVDNCEHLLNACAQIIETLLKECPRLQILATSREALRLEGEALYHVHPLAVPASDQIPSLDELMKSESVRLFAERAALADAAFALTERNAHAVVAICERLDGIPLAIELAAAHVDLFKVEEIRKQLDRSFDLLATQTRSIFPRHQTMHTCIDWGWNLLTEPERLFARRLSVFRGGWTMQAAEAMNTGDPLELTSALAKKSFVVVDSQEEEETRYGFHEVIRTYAYGKLVEAGEEKAMRDRHLNYFLVLARSFEPALQGVDQPAWLERLFLERHNIRAALEWAARTNVHAGLYLSGRLRAFWERCELPEEKHWLLMI